MGRRIAVALLALAFAGSACSDSEQLQSGTVEEVIGDQAAAPATSVPDEDDEDDRGESDGEKNDGSDGDADAPNTSAGDAVPAGGDGEADVPNAEDESGDLQSDDTESGDPQSDDADADIDADDPNSDASSDNPDSNNADSNNDGDRDESNLADDEPAATEDDDSESGVQPIALTVSAPGDSGDHVEALQERLAELGFGPGTPDGDYGRKTTKAVVAFQRLLGLNETGNVDTRTLGALAVYRYEGLLLEAGDEGDDVEELQQRLADGPFDPGPVDGAYGTGTKQAVWALEKLADIPVDGDWGPLDEQAFERLLAGAIGKPENSHDQRWVEVDLNQQVMKVYDPGSTTPTLISHASSGSGIPWENEEFSGSSITPVGDFHINRRINGWRESSLNIGRLYNPLYFNGGIAFHGATSVPLHPASHGCIRLPMHVADYLPGELPNGTPVHIIR